MGLKDVKAYWALWVSKEAKGDPFSFIREKVVVVGEVEEEEEEEETQPTTSKPLIKAPTPPTPTFDIDNGIPLPLQCNTPVLRTICLNQLGPKWGDASKTFHTLVELVDALKVSSVVNGIIPLYLILFQDTSTPSGFQNCKWPFIKWSWDSVHLAEETHNNRRSLDGFLKWLDLKISGLSKQKSLNKNQLQELLLGVGLYLRDLELAHFTDHGETSVPDYLANSEMTESDADPLNRVLQLFSDALHKDSGYVSYKLRLYKH
jgi:hypothetical protein